MPEHIGALRFSSTKPRTVYNVRNAVSYRLRQRLQLTWGILQIRVLRSYDLSGRFLTPPPQRPSFAHILIMEQLFDFRPEVLSSQKIACSVRRTVIDNNKFF